MENLSPNEFINRLRNHRVRGIDVRSESEFDLGSLPESVNLPILRNPERHLVGLTYKERGQDAAVALGHELVRPTRTERVSLWKNLAQMSPPPAVYCWRGGLRSRTTAQWLEETGTPVPLVTGGYKAIRKLLLERLEGPFRFLVLSGMTGTKKTKLLQTLNVPKVDIEGLAKHRGSSFGSLLTQKQPSQQTFENLLALELWDPTKTYLVEDESPRLGSVVFPRSMKDEMRRSEFVVLELPLADRISEIFAEYISSPLSSGVTKTGLRDHYRKQLIQTRRRLGGLRYQQIDDLLAAAFSKSLETDEWTIDLHGPWIESLLKDHYDPTYQHAFGKNPRNIIFSGTPKEAGQFIIEYYRGR